MTTSKVPVHNTGRKMNLGHTVVRASLGAIGVASDHVNRIIHLESLWRILVHRGERIENRALARVRRNA